MREKRSQSAGSSTQHTTPLVIIASASLSPAKVMKPSGPPVSPVAHQSDGESDQLKMGGFLEKCHYCQKRIAQNSEVFMNSNLCAFCSAECRGFQIAKEQLVETQPGNTPDKTVPPLMQTIPHTYLSIFGDGFMLVHWIGLVYHIAIHVYNRKAVFPVSRRTSVYGWVSMLAYYETSKL